MLLADLALPEEFKHTPLSAQEMTPSESFVPFTGKVTRNKVRLRVQPSFDSVVVKELVKGDMLVILGEQEAFYAVQPPPEVKGYVYRTYVLDNAIEGNRVNVRLTPDTEGAILTQLNSGDFVEGVISPLNSKWYEIKLPSAARLWVCKEYIEQIGPPTLMAQIERRRGEANSLLNTAFLASQAEMNKPFPEINLQPILDSFSQIVNEYRDFPEQAGRARELISELQEDFLMKKIAYLEDKAKASETKKPLLLLPEEQGVIAIPTGQKAEELKENDKFAPQSLWQEQEDRLFAEWQDKISLERGIKRDKDTFYTLEEADSVALQGIIEPYDFSKKNKPGDFLLVSAEQHQPIAYLYSTKINLADYSGKPVKLRAVARANNGFALPAYMVLDAR
jgi:hypothetical protein